MKLFKSFFKKDNEAENNKNKCVTERFKSLYEFEFSTFLDYLVKQDSEKILNQCNHKISAFVFDNSYDPLQNILDINNWLDKMAADTEIYDINAKTKEVREKTELIFKNQVNRLIEANYLLSCEVSDEICEAVFLRNSINVFLNIMYKRFGIM